jgi:alkaline phosphatase
LSDFSFSRHSCGTAAARVYAGGEDKKMSFENFPYTANSKTYCVDLQVSDSACTATAYLNGIKARGSTIGLNAKAKVADCLDSMDPEKRTESIASWAMKAGKDAGFVTTTRVTHASPAGLYTHIAYRHWETDNNVKSYNCDPSYVDDVTEQLVHNETPKKFKVIFGGGSRSFVNVTERIHGAAGYRTDGKNLINEWLNLGPGRTYVDDRAGLMALDPTKVDQVMGLFDSSHVPYNLNIQRDNLQSVKPSLKDMTEKAIDILSKKPEGFFLFVEGGRIDHGHHETRAKYAVDETVEFSKAIQAAVDKVDIEETLIIVTADHGHVMTMAGYAVSTTHEVFGELLLRFLFTASRKRHFRICWYRH